MFSNVSLSHDSSPETDSQHNTTRSRAETAFRFYPHTAAGGPWVPAAPAPGRLRQQLGTPVWASPLRVRGGDGRAHVVSVSLPRSRGDTFTSPWRPRARKLPAFPPPPPSFLQRALSELWDPKSNRQKPCPHRTYLPARQTDDAQTNHESTQGEVAISEKGWGVRESGCSLKQVLREGLTGDT